jgi:hypothetical protein
LLYAIATKFDDAKILFKGQLADELTTAIDEAEAARDGETPNWDFV